MSKDVNSYRPTSYSSKTVLREPMATRGVVVSTNTSDDSNDQSDDQRVTDADAFLKDNPLTDEVCNLICRLPSMCSLLTSPDTCNYLNMNELQIVARALKINTAQSNQVSMRSRRSRERGIQTKTQILSLISEKFGEQWTTICDIANDMKNSSRSARRRKPNRALNATNLNCNPNEARLNGNRSEINRAISYVQTSPKLPTRDELIFLTDDEYEAAIRYYRATHPEVIDLNELQSGSDVTALEQLAGTFKETTEALHNCLQQAIKTRKFIEKIKENQKGKNASSPNFNNNFTNQQDTESSEEHL